MLRLHKKTALISVVCLVVVIGVAVYVYYPSWGNSQSSVNSEGLGLSASPTSIQTISTSTNSDWQKTFFSLPSISRDAASSTSTSTPEKLTQTDVLGREFLVAYTQLQQAGLSNDPDSVNKAASQLADDAVSRLKGQKMYTLMDLNITQNNTQTAMQTYAVSGQKILATLPAPEEALLATNALESGNTDQLKTIDPIISAYQNALNDLLTMPVPSLFASDHLNLVNGISMEVFDAQGLRQSDVDPVGGLAALSQELVAMQSILDAINNIQQSLASVGISAK